MQTQKKIKDLHIVTLGCSKNLVDSEALIGQLNAHQLKIDHNANNSQARNVIINTCGFIADAKEESINTILQYIEAKQRGELDTVTVMGCLSERYANELRSEIPEVDAYFGVNDINKIVENLGYDYRKNLVGERAVTTPGHYAYVKISEGCDRTCAFCAIPLIRGKHKSKTIDALVKEATSLSSKGVKELILIAQDLTYYGVDIYKKQCLDELLSELVNVDGIEWIRLHYAYPAHFPKKVIEVMAREPKICNYLDIPFQHISDNVLKGMRRGVTSHETRHLIDYFRKTIPSLTLRTTLLTGYPNETGENFNQLLEFVQQTRFNRLGVFTYSEEEDTFAARKFEDSIPEEIKQRRLEQLMETQAQISLELNQAKVGNSYKTIIDRVEGAYYIGRTEADSPEVDNEVLITADQALNIGTLVDVEITEAQEFDLYGVVRIED